MWVGSIPYSICLVVVHHDGVVIEERQVMYISFSMYLLQPAAAAEQGCAGAEGAEQQELLQELQ